MSDRPRYQLLVEMQPDPVPAVNRFRRWIRWALRAYGVKILDYRQVDDSRLRDDAGNPPTPSDGQTGS